jgi:hypothetical protein
MNRIKRWFKQATCEHIWKKEEYVFLGRITSALRVTYNFGSDYEKSIKQMLCANLASRERCLNCGKERWVETERCEDNMDALIQEVYRMTGRV